MASSSGKRVFPRGTFSDGNCSKKLKLIDDSQGYVRNFITWSQRSGLILSDKVCVSTEGSCAQYGMIAIRDIDAGETLFEIPRTILLSSENSAISDLLRQELLSVFVLERDSIQSSSGWIPLLLAVIHETNNPDSKWKPYLELLPNFDELDLPMFWPRELESLLVGTGVVEAVMKDLDSINTEFNTVVLPFMRRHPDRFPQSCQNIESYKRAVAFVMAYSFTEPPSSANDDDNSSHDDSDNEDETKTISTPPMMVPMADILNHVAKNNAHLDFGIDNLKMVSTKSICAGEEVFNTYGELANWQLLHMYGFSERHIDNQYDAMTAAGICDRQRKSRRHRNSVPNVPSAPDQGHIRVPILPSFAKFELPSRKVFDIIIEGLAAADMKLAEQKWQFLKQVEVVADDCAFVLGVNGFLTEEEMFTTLKVMTMSKEAFEEHREKEGWSDAEDESSIDISESLSFDDIVKLPALWKEILKKIASAFLQSVESGVPTEIGESDLKTSRRRRFADYVIHGQREMLNRLLLASSS